ncbi:hypothetical protein [Poriferisphaera sp. WC338]|uniref:hypothetical protein n=1 Tax=Poriferisphaera sp. WC338 TaxID=3425129 RepID=UPI003D81306F
MMKLQPDRIFTYVMNVLKGSTAVTAVLLIYLCINTMSDAKQPQAIATFITSQQKLPTKPGEAAKSKSPSKGYLDLSSEQAKKRDIFNPVPSKGFKGQLEGILGNRAYFNGGQNGKIGEQVMGAKIIDLGADWVEIEFDGNKRTLWVWGAGKKPNRNHAPPSAEQAKPQETAAQEPTTHQKEHKKQMRQRFSPEDLKQHREKMKARRQKKQDSRSQ